MKKLCILIAIALLAAGGVFADKSVLIDFSKLTADVKLGDRREEQRAHAPPWWTSPTWRAPATTRRSARR